MIAGHSSRFLAVRGAVDIGRPIRAAACDGHNFILVFHHEGPEAYLVAVSHALFGQMDMEPVTVAGGVLLGFVKVVFHRGLEGMPRGKVRG